MESIRNSVVMSPADKTVFAVDLNPGRYGLVCFLPGPTQGSTHAFAGMASEFVAGTK